MRVIDEQEVKNTLVLAEVTQRVREAFVALERGEAALVPRTRLPLGGGVLCWIAGVLKSHDLAGAKIYSNVGAHRSSCLVTFRASTGELLGVVESYFLSLLRTAATTAIATDCLARADATSLGVLGSGSTAQLQVEGISLVRAIDTVRVFSRQPERRQRLAENIESSLGLTATAVESAEAAVDGADVVLTATNSAAPIVNPAWIKPGAHLNVIGSNFPDRREIDSVLVATAARVVTESITAAKAEAGDLRLAVEEGAIGWEQVVELGSTVLGETEGRTGPLDVTIFKSVGICPEDLAAASLLFRTNDATH